MNDDHIFRKPDPNQLGDQPIEPHMVDKMRALAKGVDMILNGEDVTHATRQIGFCLMVFPFGPGFDGRCNYISTAKRDDVVTLLKEQLRRFEGQAEVKGHG